METNILFKTQVFAEIRDGLSIIRDVFTSPEARDEFSGEKIKPRRWSKPFKHIQIYIRLKGQL